MHPLSARAALPAALLAPLTLLAANPIAGKPAPVGARCTEGGGGAPASLTTARGDALRPSDLLQRVDLTIKHGVRFK